MSAWLENLLKIHPVIQVGMTRDLGGIESQYCRGDDLYSTGLLWGGYSWQFRNMFHLLKTTCLDEINCSLLVLFRFSWWSVYFCELFVTVVVSAFGKLFQAFPFRSCHDSLTWTKSLVRKNIKILPVEETIKKNPSAQHKGGKSSSSCRLIFKHCKCNSLTTVAGSRLLRYLSNCHQCVTS